MNDMQPVDTPYGKGFIIETPPLIGGLLTMCMLKNSQGYWYHRLVRTDQVTITLIQQSEAPADAAHD